MIDEAGVDVRALNAQRNVRGELEWQQPQAGTSVQHGTPGCDRQHAEHLAPEPVQAVRVPKCRRCLLVAGSAKLLQILVEDRVDHIGFCLVQIHNGLRTYDNCGRRRSSVR